MSNVAPAVGPSCSARVSDRMSTPIPAASSTEPRTSSPSLRRSPARSSTTERVKASATAAANPTRKKIHGHPSAKVTSPPSTAPATIATSIEADMYPSARSRRRPSGVEAMSSPSAAGSASAAPSPASARADMRSHGARATAAKSDALENSARPVTSIRRRPSRSAARPPTRRNAPIVTVYAVTTHCRFEVEMWRSRWITGSATLTTIPSSITRNSAANNTATGSPRARNAPTFGWAVAVIRDSVARPRDRQTSLLLPARAAGGPARPR